MSNSTISTMMKSTQPKNIITRINRLFTNVLKRITQIKHNELSIIDDDNKRASKMDEFNIIDNKYVEISMTYFIIYNFNNYVNDNNRFRMYTYINRFREIINECAKKYVKYANIIYSLACVCVCFANDTIPFTGANMLISFKKKNGETNETCESNRTGEYLTEWDIYDMFNERSDVIYCKYISHNVFLVMFLSKKDAMREAHYMKNKEIVVNDCDVYGVSCSKYLHNQENFTTNRYDWSMKKHVEIINIPFNTPVSMTIDEAKLICAGERYSSIGM